MRGLWSKPIETWADIDGIEHDVFVVVDYQPAEADTNTPEGIEIESVECDGDCVMHKMTEDEQIALEHRIYDIVIGGIEHEH